MRFIEKEWKIGRIVDGNGILGISVNKNEKSAFFKNVVGKIRVSGVQAFMLYQKTINKGQK